MTRNRLTNSPSKWAACCDTPPNFNIGAETLRKWVIQADTGTGTDTDTDTDTEEELPRQVALFG